MQDFRAFLPVIAVAVGVPLPSFHGFPFLDVLLSDEASALRSEHNAVRVVDISDFPARDRQNLSVR